MPELLELYRQRYGLADSLLNQVRERIEPRAISSIAETGPMLLWLGLDGHQVILAATVSHDSTGITVGLYVGGNRVIPVVHWEFDQPNGRPLFQRWDRKRRQGSAFNFDEGPAFTELIGYAAGLPSVIDDISSLLTQYIPGQRKMP